MLKIILNLIFIIAFILCLILLGLSSEAEGKEINPLPVEIKAIYLGSNNIFNEKKIAELEKIIKTTNANGIVIDFKDSNSLTPKYQNYMANLVERFKKQGAYTIARIVAFQDTGFARKHPEVAIKTSSGEFWWSGRKVWKRYWLDPASKLAQDYNIEVAKRAIDAGFDEIQFDYIRFPTDGNMKDIHYPIFNPAKNSKTAVMAKFFEKMRKELKSYSPNTLIAIDVFGEVCLNGSEPGIGQDLANISKYFDVICPMAYPSHYKPGIFGKGDPNLDPYDTYYRTIRRGLFFLGKENSTAIIRLWIQDFSMANIYGGKYVYYGPDKVRTQIQAGRDLGIKGFMLWNANNNFTIEVLK